MGSIDKMTEHAGELLFEASGQNPPVARGTIKELAHHLGRLYGEAIRACRGYDGLRDEVTTTFMCGMALEPNFGREEVLRDSGAEEREEKALGQLLFEKECGSSARSWDKLPLSCRIAYENKAKERAAMEKVLNAPVGAPLPPDSPFATIDWDKDEEVQASAMRKLDESLRHRIVDFERRCEEEVKQDMLRQIADANRTQETDAKLCWKCKGTKDMGFTTHVPCDAC